MSLTKLTENLNNISSLPDKPSLEPNELKALFDKAGNDIKNFINETMTEELDNLIANKYTELNNKISANASTITTAQLDKIYPVGSIYMSVNTTDPSQLMGGTWERIKDKFILASGDTYANGSTGGNATHTHTNPNTSYSGNTGSTALTINQIPAHAHDTAYNGTNSNLVCMPKGSKTSTAMGPVNGSTGGGQWVWNKGVPVQGGGQGHTHTMNHTHTIGNTGSSSNLPPYLAVVVWKRIS